MKVDGEFPGSRKRSVQCFRRFGAGFRGKFYAEDVKVADKKFLDALRPLGASKIRVLRLAGFSLILPSDIRRYALHPRPQRANGDRHRSFRCWQYRPADQGPLRSLRVRSRRYDLRRRLRCRLPFGQDISPNTSTAHRMRRDSMLEKPVAVSKADEWQKPAPGPSA